jgi:hypothetical protein
MMILLKKQHHFSSTVGHRNYSEIKNEKPISLGKSPVQVSVPLGIGTWAWGDKVVWEYP